eukprot:256929-Pleurochrysis_carterae.AAC.2
MAGVYVSGVSCASLAYQGVRARQPPCQRTQECSDSYAPTRSRTRVHARTRTRALTRCARTASTLHVNGYTYGGMRIREHQAFS